MWLIRFQGTSDCRLVINSPIDRDTTINVLANEVFFFYFIFFCVGRLHRVRKDTGDRHSVDIQNLIGHIYKMLLQSGKKIQLLPSSTFANIPNASTKMYLQKCRPEMCVQSLISLVAKITEEEKSLYAKNGLFLLNGQCFH